MKIYIASSWKNQHGVEMLTTLLRDREYEVVSWIENNFEEGYFKFKKEFSFEEWMHTESAKKAFDFDTLGAIRSDVVIYYGPAGKDACMEVGAAWASQVPIIGLYAKGEDLGLMRKMMYCWVNNYLEVLDELEKMKNKSTEQNDDLPF